MICSLEQNNKVQVRRNKDIESWLAFDAQ